MEALHHEMTKAQEAKTKHVSKANAKLDAQATEVPAKADRKGVEAHTTFYSLELRACASLSSICWERSEDLLVVSSGSYAELSSKLVEELDDATLKVDGILEDECRDLFYVATTHVFSHLLLRDPSFNFNEVICPVPKDSRED
ncbi:hypothetical protein D1007_34616 [Hordeum vulgare]|nr:hypothetical protein D1007_34616 [Hordeum vulgare]